MLKLRFNPGSYILTVMIVGVEDAFLKSVKII